MLSASRPAHGGTPGPVNGVHPIPNASGRPERRFAFEPAAWIETFYRIAKNRQTIAGFYHSHPSGSTLPSLADAAGWPGSPNASYWIVSLSGRDRGALIKAYLPQKDASGALMFTQVSVQIA